MKTTKPALIILAGGYSSRMGEFKPLLPFGDKPVILHIIDIYRTAGVGEVAVVCGHRGDELAEALAGSGALAIQNPLFDKGMYTSVLAGVNQLAKLDVPAFFVTPTDFPLLSPSTPAAQLQAMAGAGADVVYPLYKGVRGHPPLISARLIPSILAYDGQGGLKRGLELWGKKVLELDFEDMGVVADMDSMDDYLWMLRLAGHELPCPDDARCLALMQKYGAPQWVIDHCKAVAAFADGMCAALQGRGHELDCRLLHAAALLHDIARSRPGHDRAACEILRNEGYTRLAAIVQMHNNIEYICIDEAALLYYADKRILETETVTLEQRFAASWSKCKTEEARAAHAQRFEHAKAIEGLLIDEGAVLP